MCSKYKAVPSQLAIPLTIHYTIRNRSKQPKYTMTRFKFLIHLSITMLALLYGVSSYAKYSNVIFFGDSLTDIGNFPPSIMYSGDHSQSGIFTNLYVPISNPVLPIDGTAVNDKILPGLKYIHAFPPLSDGTDFRMTLPPQPQIYDHGIGHQRRYYALSWAEYFTYNGIKAGLLQAGTDLRPWVLQFKRQRDNASATLSDSVNYAWASALSNNICSDFNYDAQACDTPQMNMAAYLNQQQLNYRQHQHTDDADANISLRDKLVIPGTPKQIELFQADLAQHRINVDHNTVYIIWTGANDISVAFGQFNAHKNIFAFIKALVQTIPNSVIANAQQLLKALPADKQPKVILLAGQINLSLTPEFFDRLHLNHASVGKKQLTANIVSLLATLYDHALKTKLDKLHRQGQLQMVHYVDLQTPVTQWATLTQYYHNSIGQKCETALSPTAATSLATGGAISCFNTTGQILDSMPILFWNGAHGSQQFEQIIANTMLQALQAATSLSAH